MKSFSKHAVTALLALMLIAGFYSLLSEQFKTAEEIPISQLVSDINAGNVKAIKVTGDDIRITFQDGSIKNSKKEPEAAISQTLKNYNVSEEQLSKINLAIENPSGAMFWLGATLPFLIPILLIFFFFWMASRQVKNTNLQAFSFGKSRARVIGPDDKKEKITFKDVAGVQEAKEELKEIVEFLKNPEKFLNIGARIPKGVLLMGAPGTGKTLLARAVAGEANVPFFHISGSEFVELFVGIGASRVRDLFKMAKKSAPAIIFIDEIDAVGRQRGAGWGGGHDEREQTLNQILVEMDGFEPHEKVIVMAATNRPDVLDPALLRPGRFDRRVILDLPDKKERMDILSIHAKGKPFGEDVKLETIAERTVGFSGADLQNLMNEGAIFAARENRKKISQLDLIKSIEKVLLGPERKSHLLTIDEKKIAAYHEAGHALISSILPHADPVHKVSVVSRGRAAGYTLKLPSEERHLYSKSHFLDEIAVSLGGYAAEKFVFKDITTGAADDLSRATQIARSLIMRYGMSDKIGPVVLGEKSEQLSIGGFPMTEKNYSEDVAKEIDKEISKTIGDSFKKAADILLNNKVLLDKIANTLIEKETIEREEFDNILKEAGIKPKKGLHKELHP
ncbi:ATP-dependent zinc metalloprotease FtsH [Patescibacteria group bacterium]|nr:ATP-dependent zinc metalloprotease FtsH [Patescibacteria group bacterium]MBU4353279.1 ATP-dependent zinc metalloprotease FtsH [Patescibacteria group bacterium]MBU4477022.1 ATP-dependent zinc metalloprotease FtsH [Patescibacteria group bacterium]MCG2699326.1 ATP-dependent zinc metalloprotease FtsH [Candidatus Parcubacteria bacterium]